MIPEISTPLSTGDLPGSGGTFVEPEDFEVEEIPAYLPQGSGEHCMALIEKRNLTTPMAIQQICSELGLDRRGVGYAGLKDRRAVTRQWISAQGTTPRAMLQIQREDLRVLEADLHRNKLRTGHLNGNRFTIVLRGSAPDGHERAVAVLDRLIAEGMPNFFGAQRFGRSGDNSLRGLEILRKERRPPRDRVLRRLLISALQSHIFNVVLARRVEDRLLGQLVGGEVLQRTDSSGLFVSEDSGVDGGRLAAKELVITGPICGPRMTLPLAGSQALAREQAVFDAFQLAPVEFEALGRLARGGRRPLTVSVQGATVAPHPEVDGLKLEFTLPPGSYATVLLREVTKNDDR